MTKTKQAKTKEVAERVGSLIAKFPRVSYKKLIQKAIEELRMKGVVKEESVRKAFYKLRKRGAAGMATDV
jgi:outer membrane protein assembly factor BamD (BamD/ComL family)